MFCVISSYGKAAWNEHDVDDADNDDNTLLNDDKYMMMVVFQSKANHRERVYLVALVHTVFDSVTLTLTDDLNIRTRPSYSEVLRAYKNELLGQGFQTLEHEQDIHSDRFHRTH